VINGNVMTGVKTSADGFLGAHVTEVNVIPEGDDVHEIFGWIMPRFNDYSSSRAYMSWLMGKKEYALDARVKGGERHMIMSGEYDRVFPMDIFPEVGLPVVEEYNGVAITFFINDLYSLKANIY
jgi:Na+-transporting NADH:ubiquinone oxidoreductase subunit A